MNKFEIKREMYFSKTEVAELLKATRQRYESDKYAGRKTWVNNWVLLNFALFTGLRVSEIRLVTIADIDFRSGTLKVNTKKRREARTDIITIEKNLLPLLREYTRLRLIDDYLFSMNGKPYSIRALQTMFKKCLELCKNCAFTAKSIHSARHTYAVYYLDKTKDLRATQAQMRHANIQMTSHYAQPTPERLAEYSEIDLYDTEKDSAHNDNSLQNMIKLDTKLCQRA